MSNPIDALATHAELLSWYEDDVKHIEQVIRQGARPVAVTTLKSWLWTERCALKTLDDAKTFYAASWVVDALWSQADTFPEDYLFNEEDLIEQSGFVLLEAPVIHPRRAIKSVRYETFEPQDIDGTPTTFCFSWVVTGDKRGVLFTIYGTNRDVRRPDATESIRVDDDGVISDEGKPRIRLSQLILFGKEWSQNDVGALGDAYDEDRKIITLFLSFNLFARQKIVTRARVHADRPTRRRLERERSPLQPFVQTIHLRAAEHARQDTAGDDDATDRTYHVRWVIRGHWHRHWKGPIAKPEERRLTPLWHEPTVAGPAGAPLKDTTKLFAVVR